MRNVQSGLESSRHIVIKLEIVPEDGHNADPATAVEIGREAIDMLRNDGYVVQPVYTGLRGGILVEVIPPLTTMATELWAQKDIILSDVSALVTILGAVISIAKHIRKAYEQPVSKRTTPPFPIKITTEIDGVPVSIEAPDLESAEGAMKLAKHFQKSHPAIAEKVTLYSDIKMKGSVPKNQIRPRK